MLKKHTDEEVWEGLLTVNDTIYMHCYKILFKFAQRHIQKKGSKEPEKDAHDLTTTTINALIKKVQIHDSSGNSITSLPNPIKYATGIYKNKWADTVNRETRYYKEKNGEISHLLPKNASSNDLDYQEKLAALREIIEGLINKLSSTCKKILIAYWLKQSTHEDIVNNKDIPINTLKTSRTTVSTCKDKLKKLTKLPKIAHAINDLELLRNKIIPKK